MNPPSPRHQPALQAAAQRVKNAAREAAQRCVDSLGLAALSALKIRERDDFLAAQFELNRRQAQFAQAFDEVLDRRIERETKPTESSRGSPSTTWESLSLVEDHEVEANISAERFGLAIQHACEWELRELDAYMGSLLRLASPDHDRNPLRPELVGQALVIAVEAVSERPEVRKLLAAEIGRGLGSSMPKVYGDIVADLRGSGLQPLSLALRSAAGAGHESGRHTSGYGSLSQAGDTGAGPGSGAAGGGPGPGGGWQHSSGPGRASVHGGPHSSGRGTMSGQPSGFGGGGTPIGHVDAQLMTLIRRLASLGAGSFEPMSGATGGGGEFSASLPGSGPSTGGSMPMVAPNLIYAHRDELRQASTGTLDHMVIDVVGSLFEQILADPKVPPQMARQIARLQLPVLRVALGDNTFFSSRRHPVRRFVNRIASLACSFDDFTEGAGKEFLGRVKDLVQEIVAGDFDQIEMYEQKLDALERFIAEQAAREVEEQGANAVEMLEAKEHDLRVQQRYMRQLQSALATVDMQEFLREFLTQVWSQALVQAARRDGGEGGDLARRLKRAGRELVMSVQPKGSPADRKNFLMQLPQLMKDLNDGLNMIGWPEAAKKNFFAQLLPAHAESLKGQSMRQLDYNLLVKQLDAILASPLPQNSVDMPRFVDGLPVLDDAVDNVRFSPEEAEQIGLVAESAINWSGKIDIDLSAEPELTEVDINLDGLPPPEPVEPMRGASLANHVQLGFSYQMHLEEQWQKVKLSYVSPGRAFFVFTRGKKHQKTISLTARMLHRLCDSNRLRAFENAFLIERATARARKQLAELKAGAPSTRH